MNSLLSNLTPAERQDEAVQHALQVRLALASSNYRRFFQLFNNAPKMGAYMMDHFLARERVTALVTISKAYVTRALLIHEVLITPIPYSYMNIPLSFVASQLAFETQAEAHDFLARHAAAIYTPASGTGSTQQDRQIDCRAIRQILTDALANYTKVDIKSVHDPYVQAEHVLTGL